MKDTQLDELVDRYILDGLTDAETEALTVWLDESPEHQSRFVSAIEIIRAIAHRNSSLDAKVEKSRGILGKLRQAWLPILTAAAAVGLILGIGSLLTKRDSALDIRILAAESVGTLNTEQLYRGELVNLLRGKPLQWRLPESERNSRQLDGSLSYEYPVAPNRIPHSYIGHLTKARERS